MYVGKEEGKRERKGWYRIYTYSGVVGKETHSCIWEGSGMLMRGNKSPDEDKWGFTKIR